MNYLINFSFLLLLTSCGGNWYLETAPKQSTYIEEPKQGSLSAALSKSSNSTIIIDGDPKVFETKGQGFNLGLTYQSLLVHQKFQYYTNTYDKISYTYTVDGSAPINANINYDTSGYSYLLGMMIGNFIPRVALRVENQTTTTKTDLPSSEEVKKDGQLFVGYGIEFKIPVTQSLEVFGSWDRTLKVSKDPNFRIRNDEIAVGINYNPFAKGGTKVRPNDSLLPYWRLY
jgi:hypothetical protein